MQKYKLSADYLLQQIGEDTVLLPCGKGSDVDFSQMIVLNETGAAIVTQMVDTYMTIDELIAKLESEYKNISDNLAEDVNKFVMDMYAQNLLTAE